MATFHRIGFEPGNLADGTWYRQGYWRRRAAEIFRTDSTSSNALCLAATATRASHNQRMIGPSAGAKQCT
jgi:hypothetical protein